MYLSVVCFFFIFRHILKSCFLPVVAFPTPCLIHSHCHPFVQRADAVVKEFNAEVVVDLPDALVKVLQYGSKGGYSSFGGSGGASARFGRGGSFGSRDRDRGSSRDRFDDRPSQGFDDRRGGGGYGSRDRRSSSGFRKNSEFSEYSGGRSGDDSERFGRRDGDRGARRFDRGGSGFGGGFSSGSGSGRRSRSFDGGDRSDRGEYGGFKDKHRTEAAGEVEGGKRTLWRF